MAFLLVAVGAVSLHAAEPAPKIRVAAYNVAFGSMGSPEQIGEMLKAYDLDLVGLCEVPAGDWSVRMGKVLGMDHVYVGQHSPLGYKDKYKAIISRTPLADTREYHLGRGWSAVAGRTTVRGVPLSVYSLHVGGRAEGHQKELAQKILPADKSDNVLMMGDFNSVIGPNRGQRNNEGMSWLLAAGMRPTWTDLKFDIEQHFTLDTNDRNSLKLYGVIDHILIGPKSKLKAVRGGIIELDKPLSDHKPVWAELE
jgi:endonuclease/exonuclease/phosphatase family metal-dependent hydrolase